MADSQQDPNDGAPGEAPPIVKITLSLLYILLGIGFFVLVLIPLTTKKGKKILQKGKEFIFSVVKV